jgi:DnaK suppressor protein
MFCAIALKLLSGLHIRSGLLVLKDTRTQQVDTKKIKSTRERLSSDYEKLIKSINRSRLAASEIQFENTEDEGDLATISHDRDLLYYIHEGGFARLRCIQEAIRAIDRGQYGECTRCGKDINEEPLNAVPWARMCIHCQEEEEMDQTSSHMVLALDSEETQL